MTCDHEALAGEAAAREINKLAQHPLMGLLLTEYVKDQMYARSLIMSDILHALRHGDVSNPARAASRRGFFKYRVDCLTPNSDMRRIGVVCIPDFLGKKIKIIDVSWIDETASRTGTLSRDDNA